MVCVGHQTGRGMNMIWTSCLFRGTPILRPLKRYLAKIAAGCVFFSRFIDIVVSLADRTKKQYMYTLYLTPQTIPHASVD